MISRDRAVSRRALEAGWHRSSGSQTACWQQRNAVSGGLFSAHRVPEESPPTRGCGGRDGGWLNRDRFTSRNRTGRHLIAFALYDRVRSGNDAPRVIGPRLAHAVSVRSSPECRSCLRLFHPYQYYLKRRQTRPELELRGARCERCRRKWKHCMPHHRKQTTSHNKSKQTSRRIEAKHFLFRTTPDHHSRMQNRILVFPL